MGEAWIRQKGAWLGLARPSGWVTSPAERDYRPVDFSQPGDKFLSCKQRPGRFRGGMQGRDYRGWKPAGGGFGLQRDRERGRFYRRTRLSTSETVMSVIDQLGPVIKAQKMRPRLGNGRSSSRY